MLLGMLYFLLGVNIAMATESTCAKCRFGRVINKFVLFKSFTSYSLA
jgi:hypothetical protein